MAARWEGGKVVAPAVVADCRYYYARSEFEIKVRAGTSPSRGEVRLVLASGAAAQAHGRRCTGDAAGMVARPMSFVRVAAQARWRTGAEKPQRLSMHGLPRGKPAKGGTQGQRTRQPDCAQPDSNNNKTIIVQPGIILF